jgi:hypothetical protein
MSTLRLSRSAGFGFRPAQTFEPDSAPFRVGTVSGCKVKFDAGWDKGVASQQGELDFGDRGWFWRELAGRTLLDGTVLKPDEQVLIDGVVEVELVKGGPKLQLEGVAQTGSAWARMADQAAVAPLPVTSTACVPERGADRDGEWKTRQRLLTGVMAAVLVIVVGAAVWWWGLRPKNTDDIWTLPEESAAGSPEASGAQAGRKDEAQGQNPQPTPGDERPDGRQDAKAWTQENSLQRALDRHWQGAERRSTYAAAYLSHRDRWLERQLPWIEAFEASQGRKTLRGMDFPGFFVPEVMHQEEDNFGIPWPVSMEMEEMIAAGLVEHSGSKAARRTGSNRAARLSKEALTQRTLAVRKRNQPGRENALPPKHWAVMVAVNGYESPAGSTTVIPNLPGCRNDAGALAKVLMNQGLFEPELTFLLTDAQKGTPLHATRSNVMRVLSEVVQAAGPDDFIYVGFSSHLRIDEAKDEILLMMADSATGGGDLNAEALQTILDQARATTLVTFDAFHSEELGVLAGLQSNLQSRGGAGQADRLARHAAVSSKFRSRLSESPNRAVIFACWPPFVQTSPQLPGLGHGLLATLMLSGLTGEADDNDDGLVTMGEMGNLIMTAIPKITRDAAELEAETTGQPFDEFSLVEPVFVCEPPELADYPLTALEEMEAQAGRRESPPVPTEAEREEVEKIKRGDALHAAIMEYWTTQGTRSPYIQALLRVEDFWLAKQVPWMEAFYANERQKTLRGLDFPGVFVPEIVHGNVEQLGIPVLPGDMAEQVAVAVAEVPSSGWQGGAVASLANKGGGGAVVAKTNKTALMQRLRSFVGGPSGSLARSGAEASPKAWAVLVGINRFEDREGYTPGGNNLVGCRNDVGAMAKVLMTQGIFTPERTVLLTDAQKDSPRYPSKVNVVAALTEVVQQAGPSDVIYLSFSTHGGYNPEKKDTGLMMADSMTSGSDLFGAELIELLKPAVARNILITMDACQTGGMVSVGGTQGGKQLAKERAPVEPQPIPESFYQRLGAARGHVVIRACRADQTTPDIHTLGQGLLTSLMVGGLSGDADADGDGIVTLSELRIYVTTAIPQISRRQLELDAERDGEDFEAADVLEPTFTSSSFGEAGDLPLTVVPQGTELRKVRDEPGKKDGAKAAPASKTRPEGGAFVPSRLIETVRPLPDLVDKWVSGGMLDQDALLKAAPMEPLKASN